MKALSLFLTLLSWGVIFSQPKTNAPEIIVPLLERFHFEADIRGVEVRAALEDLDSISLIKQPFYKGNPADGVYWFRGYIDLKAEVMRETETAAAKLLFLHELGHAFGLDDCKSCRYNIMKAQTSQRANYLFKDERLADVYLDIFFEAIKDPENYNKNHKHR